MWGQVRQLRQLFVHVCSALCFCPCVCARGDWLGPAWMLFLNASGRSRGANGFGGRGCVCNPEIYRHQRGSLSFSGAKLSSSIIKTSVESFWSQQWALRQTLIQTSILYTITHSEVMHTLAPLSLLSHLKRHTFDHTHILYVHASSLWKDAGQIRLVLHLLARRKFISTASQLQVHSYKTVITLAHDLTQTSTRSQRGMCS